jgi:hypothetical protein
MPYIARSNARFPHSLEPEDEQGTDCFTRKHLHRTNHTYTHSANIVLAECNLGVMRSPTDIQSFEQCVGRIAANAFLVGTALL